MINALAKLTQKPKDKTIRMIRGVFALLFILFFVFGYKTTELYFDIPHEAIFIFLLFPIIGLTRAILDPGIAKKKVWKWFIGSVGIFLIFSSLFLMEDKEIINNSQINSVSGELTINSVENNVKSDFTLSFDNYSGFAGFLLIIFGFLLNGKNITLKNERFGEKVTKIRV